VPGDLVAEFSARGLIHDSTDREALTARCLASPLTMYCGFDPTADSLHVGHLLGQISLRRAQLLGHRPIVLAGGATGMVGDPSGRSEERNLLDEETLRANVRSISSQLERLLDFSGPSGARLVNNADWTTGTGLLTFLRDVGKHVTVSQMLAKESVRNRIGDGDGLSFTEFSYMLLQANDYRHLCEHEDCEMQLGGSDQWGNITLGIDMIRRVLGRHAHGMTWPLVTRSDGRKFGKTAEGAVWLDPRRTSPYRFRQFWVQLADDDVASLLPRYSLRSLEEVAAILDEQRSVPERRVAQRSLARELTTLVHGEEASAAAEEAADVLFGANPYSAGVAALETVAGEVETTTVGRAALTDLVGLLATTGLVASNSEARRLLAQRSLRVNGTVVEDGARLEEVPLLHGRWMLLRRGKTSYHLLDVAGEAGLSERPPTR